MENEVTKEGLQHISRWQKSTKALADAKASVTRAECELSNATRELGKWLLPSDAELDEKFCVWFGDSLIAATKPSAIIQGACEYEVTMRTRGRSLNRA